VRQTVADALVEARAQLIGALLEGEEQVLHTAEAVLLEQAFEGAPQQKQTLAHALPDLFETRLDAMPNLARVAHRDLGGVARRGRTAIGDVVGEGRVDLVPHRRDDRRSRRGDGADHRLLVERPQVLDAAATAPDDEQVGLTPCIEALDGSGDLGGRALALHLHRGEHDADAGPAIAQHLDDVAHSGAERRGDHADGARIRGQRLLARGIEQTLGHQAALEFLELREQRADAGRAHLLDRRAGSCRAARTR
jgi:hypothetical protein